MPRATFGPVVGDVHPEVDVVLVLLRLADEAHVAVVQHHQHERHPVLDGDGHLLHEELEGVVHHHSDDQAVGPAQLDADAGGDLPPERAGLAATQVVAGLVGLLELATTDLVEPDGGDDDLVPVEQLVHLLEDRLWLDGHVVEVHLAEQRRAQLVDALREMDFLDAGQVERLASVTAQPYGTLVYVLAYRGLRFGESAALRRGACVLERSRLIVRESLADVRGQLHFGATKTHQRREVVRPGFWSNSSATSIDGWRTIRQRSSSPHLVASHSATTTSCATSGDRRCGLPAWTRSGSISSATPAPRS